LSPVGSGAQARLAQIFDARTAWVGREPHRATGLETSVLVLLRSLDLAGLVNGAREFTASLSAGEAAAWRESWTKTLFLFGNPANLTQRTPARIITGDASAAWLGPFPGGRLPGQSRLLKPVTGALPDLPGEMEILRQGAPADGSAGDSADRGTFRELHIAVRDLTIAEYLVHLHHTLAESMLLARLRPGEPLRLIHRPDIDLAPEEASYARVHFARGDAASLRLYTWLSPSKSR
jgi:hypothetical protein